MKSRKAPGIDAITAEVLKAGGEAMLRMLQKLFNEIWEHEKTQKDWARMLVTPIHKKGDKLVPSNYRPISLLSIPGKVFSRILLDRMKTRTEQATGESQFGFRPGRGTVDAIFIEKAKEHQVQLHFNFVDFKAAFDTIWRKALWKMMIAIGIDPKIVRIVEALYDDTECAVVIDGQLTERFSVDIGVRQRSLLSPTMFNIFLEFVMKEVRDLDDTLNLRDTFCADIRYADDTTLISAIFDKLKISTEQLHAMHEDQRGKVQHHIAIPRGNHDRWGSSRACRPVHIPWQRCPALLGGCQQKNLLGRSNIWKTKNSSLE